MDILRQVNATADIQKDNYAIIALSIRHIYTIARTWWLYGDAKMIYEQPLMIGLFTIGILLAYLGSVQKDQHWQIKFLFYTASMFTTIVISIVLRSILSVNGASTGLVRMMDFMYMMLLIFVCFILLLYGVFFVRKMLEAVQERKREKYE
jgi:hypothetical protein